MKGTCILILALLCQVQARGQVRPKPDNYCVGCKVLMKDGAIYLAYDNFRPSYLEIRPPLMAKAYHIVERVIFVWSEQGLRVFAYIPLQVDRLTNTTMGTLVAKISPRDSLGPGQNLTEIRLFKRESFYRKTPISRQADSVAFKVAKISPVSLVGPVPVTLVYEDFQQNSMNFLRTTYRQFRKPSVVYIEAGAVTGFSYRMLQVVNPMPDRALYKNRFRNETPGFAWGYSGKIGFNTSPSHSFFLSYDFTRNSFRTIGHSLNWNTGLGVDGGGGTERFVYRGIDFGYSYNAFRKKTSLSADLGFGVSWLLKSGEKQKVGFGPFIALGPKITIAKNTDLRIMPEFRLNLIPLESTKASDRELATRLVSGGIKVAVRIYF